MRLMKNDQSHHLATNFVAHVSKEKLFQKDDHLLLAVSGGVDSMVLCHLCRQAGFDFSIAHCNFQLRNAESDLDEALVCAAANRFSVPFYTKRFDTSNYKQQHKIATQEAARILRYDWFEELMTEIRNSPITSKRRVLLLTAHHGSDQVETVIFNFLRGTGIRGLAGISAKRENIRRPLLFATKDEILQYAALHQVEYREDASNSTLDYSRNFIRNEMLPAAEKMFPSVKNNLLNSAARFRDAGILYEEIVSKKIKSLVEIGDTETRIPVLKLQKMAAGKTIFHELLSGFNFTAGQEGEAWKLLEAETGKYVQSASHRILKNRKWLIISPIAASAKKILLIEEADDKILFDEGEITIKRKPAGSAPDKDPLKAYVDLHAVSFPLLLRPWKQGDYFYPFGMQKKKKLSRFFIDQKLSLSQKEKIWVIESDKKIIWIVGQRIDDRVKISPQTREIIQFTLSPK